ncbi:MAG: DUF5682 family protein, partial [Chloroflexota bacterium]
FGIRHHGPGSARYLLAALNRFQPEILLIEGPADGQSALTHIGEAGLVPPVALLVYQPDSAERAAIYPFAEWSPEWQALDFGKRAGIPARFIDLPQALMAGLHMKEPETVDAQSDEAPQTVPIFPVDPLEALGKAAGYEDGERWWDQLIEQHQTEDPLLLFEEITLAMAAVREKAQIRPETDLREAHMRLEIRKALKEGFKRIAIVCGAWHAPVHNPDTFPSQKSDREQLKGLKKVKVTTTWVPWSFERLTLYSGYGAGIRYPRWYEHIWHNPTSPERGWLTEMARLFREEGLDASTAQVIDAVRLATLLANMRGYTHPTVQELNDAAITTLCHGDQAPLLLINSKLFVGNTFGQIPETVPMVPLQQAFEATLKKLRIKLNADEVQLKLDLRKPLHLERSQFLHRLRLIGIEFGTPIEWQRGKGTFSESWKLRWQPDFLIRLIERSVWGNTLPAATTQFVIDRVEKINDLKLLGEMIGRALPAALPETIRVIAKRLQTVASLTGSIPDMMQAVPPLVNALTFGDVRQTAADMIEPVIDALVPRISVGLTGAMANLDRDGAAPMILLFNQVHGAIRTLEREDHQQEWLAALQKIVKNGSVNGLLRGRSVRLLFDGQFIGEGQVAERLNQVTSQAVEPDEVVDWLEGFVMGSGLILIHHKPLLLIIDRWMSQLSEVNFMRLLPLIRRAFSSFEMGERYQIGEILKRQTHLSNGNASITKE